MKQSLNSFVLLSFLVLATACGQSGPLYLPGNPSQIKLPPEAATESAQDEDEEEKDGSN